MRKRVTLAMIAEACETSVGTVSRAINQKSDINAETKAYILEKAAELGYRFENKTHSIGKPLRLGAVYSYGNKEFFSQITDGLEAAKRDLIKKDINVEIELFQTQYLDQTLQYDLLKTIDPGKFDGLLINCAGMEIGRLIDRFNQQGLPVATFNTDAPNSSRIFFVGTNAYDSGYLGGGLLGKMIRGQGKVATFGDFTNNFSWVERLSGFCSVLQREYPKIELIPILQSCTDERVVYESMKEFMIAHPDVTALFTPNSSSTVGTINALTELGRKDVIMVGYDLSNETRQSLKNDYCDAVLYQNPYKQGYLSVEYMVRYLLSGELPDRSCSLLPTSIIMKYNLDLADS